MEFKRFKFGNILAHIQNQSDSAFLVNDDFTEWQFTAANGSAVYRKIQDPECRHIIQRSSNIIIV